MKGKLSILVLRGGVVLIALGALSLRPYGQPAAPQRYSPNIPKMWDDKAMATLEVPLADPKASPKHALSDYYYRIPVRPIYKQYPVYAPGHEPPGYMEGLRDREPVIVWDDQGHASTLKTEADWIKAGQLIFEAPIHYNLNPGITPLEDIHDAAWYRATGTPTDSAGRLPFYSYVVRKSGQVDLGTESCAMCHTRIMPDGWTIEGAQGSFPFDAVVMFSFRKGRFESENIHGFERGTFAAPWLRPDPQAVLDRMSVDEIVTAHEAIPPGVMARHRSSPFCPPHIPDLIGVKDRHYLDASGLQRQRSMADLMRYAALNQGGDDLASFAGFVPVDFPNFKKVPHPDKVGGRYSDEQLYALALYVYSLQPPKNPNKFDALAERGEKVFAREGCAGCHTPPLYTNNMLTPAEGFTPPAEHLKSYNILPISVGTDPNLATKTRRGTGYYKVPSLKGVWYRSMFGHNGWCATLEDWFDPRRLHDDYVPTGFKPYGVKTFAVKGHAFGLNLSADDKKALIAFLKTL